MASSVEMFTDIEKAVLLGIVEGVTEFLPVSSTGHLILFGSLLDYGGNAGDAFKIFIQGGAILAVVMLYWRRLAKLCTFSPTVTGFAGWRGIALLGLGSAPALLMGALFHNVIKQHLFTPFPVAVAFIVGALVILFVERRRPPTVIRDLDSISFRDAFLVGCLQCAALWPGMSRSGATILGAMWLGFDRKVAAEFSFLVGIPILIAASLFDLLGSWNSLSSRDLTLFGVGFVTAFFAAALSVRIFVALVGRWSLRPFAWYRLLIGGLLLAFFLQ